MRPSRSHPQEVNDVFSFKTKKKQESLKPFTHPQEVNEARSRRSDLEGQLYGLGDQARTLQVRSLPGPNDPPGPPFTTTTTFECPSRIRPGAHARGAQPSWARRPPGPSSTCLSASHVPPSSHPYLAAPPAPQPPCQNGAVQPPNRPVAVGAARVRERRGGAAAEGARVARGQPRPRAAQVGGRELCCCSVLLLCVCPIINYVYYCAYYVNNKP
jgi:hypothetical protein